MFSFLSYIWEFVVDVFWSNALTTVPIIVSIIAIIISIMTAKKQNKIALFDLRYKCLSQIRTLLSFEQSIYQCDDPLLILCLFDALWGTSVSNIEYDECIIRSRCQLEMINKETIQAKYLFNHKFSVDLDEIVQCVHKIVIAAGYKKLDSENMEKLHIMCANFIKKDLPKMSKRVKL